MIIIMLIMNVQNKLYTIQFFLPLDDWFAASPRAAVVEPGSRRFCEFCKTHKRDNSWKRSNCWTREDSNSWKKKERVLPPSQHPFIN